MRIELKNPSIQKFVGVFFLGVFVWASFHFPSLSTAYLKSGFISGKSSFAVQFKDELSFYQTTSIFLLPGEETGLSVVQAPAESIFRWSGAVEARAQASNRTWTLKAPKKPGFYPARLSDTVSGEAMDLNVFVMVPLSQVKNGVLNGYRIGTYPSAGKNRGPMYNRPRGFIEVTKENRNTPLTPHFRLSQFLCKQDGNYPKYVVLRERLPLKLEAVLEKLNEKGVPAKSLSIMSGYRTPYYNRAIGNVSLSRHMFGDAADFFVDSEPRENYMADLNADGKRDQRDADVLYRILDEVEANPAFAPYVGGLARYKSTKYHGPFVHVDARGASKRWNN